MEQIITQIADTHNLRRSSGRWKGPCPKCGGSSKSDKFVLQDDGGFKCHACQFKGDIITWLRDMEGKSCPEAHMAAGIDCKLQSSCPVWSKCRMGDGSGRRTAPRRKPLTPRRAGSTMPKLPVTKTTDPKASWLAWAEELTAKAVKNIKKQEKVLKWLQNRGIDSKAVSRFRLGWLEHQYQINRASIGLPPGDNGKKTLWVPKGLLVHTPAAGNSVHRLRIRRTKADMEKFLPDLKYYWIPGSGTGPFVARPQGKIRGTVIVEAELDAIAIASAHDQVMVVALGTVSTGVPPALHRELEMSPAILVCLDADSGKAGEVGPGPAAAAMWHREFRQAKYWPVPAGKDPGEYAAQGGNIRKWIEAALASEVSHDLPLSSGCDPMGGRGGKDCKENPAPPASRMVTLTNGISFHITTDRHLWEQLAESGEIVFSEQELQRLQQATVKMDDKSRLAAAMKVIEMKQVFGSAYVCRGEARA